MTVSDPSVGSAPAADDAARIAARLAARPQIVLKSSEFRREREASWRELDRLLTRVERDGFRALEPAQRMRLPLLHRAAVSALSVARTISLDRALVRYLENLSARSFICVYGVKRHARDALGDFLRRRFPDTVRRFRGHVLVAALFLACGTLTGFLLTAREPDLYYAFVPEGMAQGGAPTSSNEDLRAVLYKSEQTAGEALAHFASFLLSHNAQTGWMCFALGFAGGLPVFLLLFVNGLILGAMAALYASRGLGLDFWCWVLPHGVTELGAVVLCGAAGLVLAQAVVFPGRHARLYNLALRGREAGQMVLGCVGMLFLAALIEGFFRQWVTSIPARLAVALASAVLWGLYFTLFTRARAEEVVVV